MVTCSLLARECFSEEVSYEKSPGSEDRVVYVTTWEGKLSRQKTQLLQRPKNIINSDCTKGRQEDREVGV